VVERGLSLSATFAKAVELARRDSGIFMEMERLFSLAPDARTGGEVTVVIVAVF
jgi:hypothetical protein